VAEKKWLFDRPWTRNFTKLRQDFVSSLLAKIREQTELQTALDVGCGLGDFSHFLFELGLRVAAVDGRAENVAEAKSRHPSVNFQQADAEDLVAAGLNRFDLVFCFGLLYHLENPFRAIRSLCAATEKVLLVETMCIPGSEPTMYLLDEGVAEDQGLNYIAFYPSEPCLVKMLYRAGFPYVYLFEKLPADQLYAATIWKERLRTMIVASKVALNVSGLVLVKERIQPVEGEIDPWSTDLRKLWVRLARMKNAVLKPLS
jgi:SAM-dependent methyltransferase